MSVRPPMGAGRVRLLSIEGIDLQACGGTHVARTGEIGRVECIKIENKGKMNRRFVIALGGLTAGRGTHNGLRKARRAGQHRLACRPSRCAGHPHRRRLVLPAGAEARPQGGVRATSTFRARCSSTSTRSPTRRARCPTCCRRRRSFPSRVRKLGLGDGNKIVVYDTTPMLGATRVWWMFRAMGHKDVAVLDGGLPKWMEEGHPVTDDPTPPRERHFTARLDNTLVRSLDDVNGLIDSKREQIVDARAANRFRGEVPEPRPGLRAGHMPGAFNLPYNELVDPKTGTMLPADKLARAHRRLRHRPVEEGDGELRLGRQRLRRGARPLPDRRAGSGGLRRLVDRMGRPCRHTDRHRSLSPVFRPPAAAPRGRTAADHRHASRDDARRLDAPRREPPDIDVTLEPVAAPDRRLLSRALRPRRPTLAVVRTAPAVRCGPAGLAGPARTRTARRAAMTATSWATSSSRATNSSSSASRWPTSAAASARGCSTAPSSGPLPAGQPAQAQHQHARPSAGPGHLSQGGLSHRCAARQGSAGPARAVAGPLSLAAA